MFLSCSLEKIRLQKTEHLLSTLSKNIQHSHTILSIWGLPMTSNLRNAVVTVLTEGSDIVGRFEGPTSELLHILMHTWWSRIGSSKASGIFKLVVADVGNMPELAQFYLDEVVTPTHQLLSRAVERGVARGEFRPINVMAVVQSMMAAAQFLMLYPYCAGSAPNNPFPLDADAFMKTQIELLLHGLEVRKPADTRPTKGQA